MGVDIAATTATVVWQAAGGSASRPRTSAQTAQGFAALRRRLRATGPAPAEIVVVLEATGSDWLSLATTLAEAGFAVSVINAGQAHHFAKALLKRAKTDALDAQTLARLAALRQPARWTPPPAIHEALKQRLAQRDARIGMRQQVRNQLPALAQGPLVIASVRERMEGLLATLAAQIAEVAVELAAVVGQDTAWTDAIRRLQSVPGVGLLTAAWIVVRTHHFTLCATAEQATAYAGLAPMPRLSGSSVRGHASIGRSGTRRWRTALSMATLSAAQHNPVITPFYRRLRDAGKPPKVARCAAARKLLHLVWASGITVLRTAYRAPGENAVCERFLGSVGASAWTTSSSWARALAARATGVRGVLQHDAATPGDRAGHPQCPGGQHRPHVHQLPSCPSPCWGDCTTTIAGRHVATDGDGSQHRSSASSCKDSRPRAS